MIHCVILAVDPGCCHVLEQRIAEPCYMVNISFVYPSDKLSITDITFGSWSKSSTHQSIIYSEYNNICRDLSWSAVVHGFKEYATSQSVLHSVLTHVLTTLQQQPITMFLLVDQQQPSLVLGFIEGCCSMNCHGKISRTVALLVVVVL